MSLRKEAHAKCFIANSVNFPVRHQPVITIKDGPVMPKPGTDPATNR